MNMPSSVTDALRAKVKIPPALAMAQDRLQADPQATKPDLLGTFNQMTGGDRFKPGNRCWRPTDLAGGLRTTGHELLALSDLRRSVFRHW